MANDNAGAYRLSVIGDPSQPTAPGTRCAFRISLAGALLVAALAAPLFQIFPATGAGYAEGYGDPVYALEMARSPADLIAVFGEAEDPERANRIEAMDRGNRLDLLFALAYGLFLAAFCRGVRSEVGARGQTFWLVMSLLGVAAALSDLIENAILLRLTTDLEGAPGIEWLAYPVWLKFSAIAAVGFAASAYLMGTRHTVAWRCAGVVALLGCFTVPIGAVDPARFGYLMGSGITLCWLVLLAYAGRRALAPAEKRPVEGRRMNGTLE